MTAVSTPMTTTQAAGQANPAELVAAAQKFATALWKQVRNRETEVSETFGQYSVRATNAYDPLLDHWTTIYRVDDPARSSTKFATNRESLVRALTAEDLKGQRRVR